MSAEARTWAKKQRTGSPFAKAVLVALADYAGSENGECWPSQATIARETELSERAVRKYLRQLEDDGFIKRKRRGTKSGGRTSDLITLDMKDERRQGHDAPEGYRHDVPGGLPERGAGGYRNDVPGGYRNDVPGPPAPRSGNPLSEPSVTISEEIVGNARTTFALTPDEPSSRKRGTRLPEDWQPSESDRAFARKQGLNEEDIDREAQKFFNHWTSKTGAGATKRDWHRTWQNWILSDLTRRSCRPGSSRRGPASSAEAFMRGCGVDPDKVDRS